MLLMEAMNRRQTRITLFIHYWMDNKFYEPGCPADLTEGEWEQEYDRWEHNILTSELLEKHCAPYEPPREAGG